MKILNKIKIFLKNLTKIEIFSKISLNRKFSKFSKKSKFFKNFDQNRNFAKIWIKIDSFRKFRKSKFFDEFDQNRIVSKIWPKPKFSKFRKNGNFSKILTIIKMFWKIFEIFRKFFWLNSKFIEKLTKIEIFRKFYPNRIFSKFDQNRNYSKILPEWNIFEIFEILTKIEILREFWPKSKFFENIPILVKFSKNFNFFENF